MVPGLCQGDRSLLSNLSSGLPIFWVPQFGLKAGAVLRMVATVIGKPKKPVCQFDLYEPWSLGRLAQT
jgi:hypothetical protein